MNQHHALQDHQARAKCGIRWIEERWARFHGGLARVVRPRLASTGTRTRTAIERKGAPAVRRSLCRTRHSPSAPIVAFGGDVILGSTQNALTAWHGPAHALTGVSELAEADLTIVNLECVVAGTGIPVAK